MRYSPGGWRGAKEQAGVDSAEPHTLLCNGAFGSAQGPAVVVASLEAQMTRSPHVALPKE